MIHIFLCMNHYTQYMVGKILKQLYFCNYLCNDVGLCCEDWTPELSRARRSTCFEIRLCVTYLSLVLFCFIKYLYFEYMRIKMRFELCLDFCYISLFWFTDCLFPWIQWRRDNFTMKGNTNCNLPFNYHDSR